MDKELRFSIHPLNSGIVFFSPEVFKLCLSCEILYTCKILGRSPRGKRRRPGWPHTDTVPPALKCMWKYTDLQKSYPRPNSAMQFVWVREKKKENSWHTQIRIIRGGLLKKVWPSAGNRSAGTQARSRGSAAVLRPRGRRAGRGHRSLEAEGGPYRGGSTSSSSLRWQGLTKIYSLSELNDSKVSLTGFPTVELTVLKPGGRSRLGSSHDVPV